MHLLGKKIVIVGSPGSGKSTLSLRLSGILNIPVYHLDNIWWNKDKTHISRDEFDAKLDEIISKDSWIIDGDYSRTYEVRFKNASTIIYLDYPLDLCLKSAKGRVGSKRVDCPFIEDEFDKEFEEYIISWRDDKKVILEDLLHKYKNKKIIVFKSREEANKYLEKINND